jgi:hypothetical protein
VDAATKYYTDIILIQKSMSHLKRRHIRSKIRTEQLKQALMKEKLESNFIPLPDLMESSDSSDDEEDEVEEGVGRWERRPNLTDFIIANFQ